MATEIDRLPPTKTFQQLATMAASKLVGDLRSTIIWAPGGGGDAATFYEVAKMIVGATHPLLVYVNRASESEPELSIPQGHGTSRTPAPPRWATATRQRTRSTSRTDVSSGTLARCSDPCVSWPGATLVAVHAGC